MAKDIYALHVGDSVERRAAAYEKLAERTNGICIQLTDERAFAEVMPILTDYLFRDQDALVALPKPNDPNVKALVDRLRLKTKTNDKV